MITDTMNGCTFGTGSGGMVRVVHVTYNTFNDEGVCEEGKPIDQGHMDAEVNRLMGGAPDMALRKAQYNSAPGTFPNVIVIGSHRGGTWTFYYQRRVFTGATVVRHYRLVLQLRSYMISDSTLPDQMEGVCDVCFGLGRVGDRLARCA